MEISTCHHEDEVDSNDYCIYENLLVIPLPQGAFLVDDHRIYHDDLVDEIHNDRKTGWDNHSTLNL